jgi:hypothetical protein
MEDLIMAKREDVDRLIDEIIDSNRDNDDNDE